MSQAFSSPTISKWCLLRGEISRSFKHIKGSPVDVFYLLVSLVLGGAAGLWIPWLAQNNEIGTDALSTYVFAVLAPVLADFLLDSGSDTESGKLEIRLFLLFVCVLAGCCALIALFRGCDTWGWFFGWFGVCLSVIAWVIVGTKSQRFPSDTQSFDGSYGGPTASPDDLAGDGLPA